MQHPTIGRVVLYRSRTGNYTVPAIITATTDTLWAEGVERGDVPALSSPSHVHLHVLTPGGQGSYTEHDVPFDDLVDGDHQPRTWRWPVISRPATSPVKTTHVEAQGTRD